MALGMATRNQGEAQHLQSHKIQPLVLSRRLLGHKRRAFLGLILAKMTLRTDLKGVGGCGASPWITLRNLLQIHRWTWRRIASKRSEQQRSHTASASNLRTIGSELGALQNTLRMLRKTHNSHDPKFRELSALSCSLPWHNKPN